MKPNDDFSAALDTAAAELRQRLAPKVSEEEIFAYVNGELSGERREQVEEAIALDPEAAELARDFAMFPEPAIPGEPGYLSPRDLAGDWETIQARISPQVHGLARTGLWRALAVALPASLVVAGLAIWGFSERNGRLGAERQLAQALDLRINVDVHTLDEAKPRGSTPVEPRPKRLEGSGDFLVLQLAVLDPQPFDDYRLEVRALEALGEVPRWSREGLRLYPDNSFSVALPRAALPPGRYELRVVGLGPGVEKPVFSYRIEIPPR